MDEFEERSPTTVGQPVIRTSPGDRLVVGLAALALLGGVFIAGANLISGLTQGQAVASADPGASHGPEPIRTPRPSPTPRPLRDITVVPSTPEPSPDPGYEVEMQWLEVTSELAVHGSASDTGTELARLAAGTVLLVQPDSPSGWISTIDRVGNGISGFIDARDAASRSRFVLHPLTRGTSSGSLLSTWSGPDRLLAWASLPGESSGGWRTTALTSKDGERWEQIDVDPQLLSGWFTATWGPSGWIAFGSSYWGSGSTVWESYDGLSWNRLGSLSDYSMNTPSQLVGSVIGYLMVTEHWSDFGQLASVWYSPDGITWEESADPFGRANARSLNGTIRLLATPSGFVAWTSSYDETPTETQVAFSANGLNWRLIAMEDPRVGDLELAAVGDALLGLGRTADGAVRAWHGDLSSAGALAFLRDETAETTLQGSVRMQVASNGEMAFAIGFDETSDAPRAWRSSGYSWAPVPFPDDARLGPFPRIAAVGPEGPVVIGSRMTAAGENPSFWHLRRDDSWVPEPEPVIPFVPDPTAAECGPIPTTALEFVTLPPEWGPFCFGDRSMTFTAYAPRCEWCSQQGSAGAPEWLMRHSPAMGLRPSKGDESYMRDAFVDPGVGDADWAGHWVRVTGQFAHPASETCAWDPDELDGWYNSTDSGAAFCRSRFVVTELTVLDGP